MASLLRQIVAGPRLQHPEAGLDLCYVTDSLIVTSGPSSTYPKRAYRNPTDALVRFLDKKHGENWAIWEFRAEGTGYPDSEVYGRIDHFPFPDHHPPPFSLIPSIMASMRNWLHEDSSDAAQKQDQHRKSTLSTSPASKELKKVAVVHCKAGKGRSGTVSCSYLISQEGWTMKDALQRFTERRMRAGFGEGVSIPSQLRWIRYVDKWTNKMNKTYVERPVEILEVHVWGLRDGVKIAVEGYVDEGRKIKCFHLFKRRERTIVDDGKGSNDGNPNNARNPSQQRSRIGEDSPQKKAASTPSASSSPVNRPEPATETVTSPQSSGTLSNEGPTQLSAAILRPEKPVILPTSDVNIDFERRTKAAYTGWAMVTSIAHVWFNAYFEGGDEHDSGVFECEWDKLDGIKGTSRKGTRALERVKVVWRYASKPRGDGNAEPEIIPGQVITVPQPGEPVAESHAADWRGDNVVCESRDEQDSPDNKVDNPPSSPAPSDASKRQDDAVRQQVIDKAVSDLPKQAKGKHHTATQQVSIAAASAVTSAVSKVAHLSRELGLRQQTDASKDVSLASSAEALDQSQRAALKEEAESSPLQKPEQHEDEENDSDMEGVKPFYENGNGNDSGDERTGS